MRCRIDRIDSSISTISSLAIAQVGGSSERFRRFPLAGLPARDKVDLDIFWLKGDALDDPDLLPPPDEVAAEIVESLETALDRFRRAAAALK